jgi:FKBP-type peptidyl-prolyl cis-trans isomerase 2
MQTIHEKEFIELDYTGRLKDNHQVFDTTQKEVAKKEGIFNSKQEYCPAIICVGEKQLLHGLDAQLLGKEIGKEYNIELPPEQAFGKKDAKLLKLISTSQFTKQQIMPTPGMQIDIDGTIGTVRSVTGGRTFVDLNHPLSGKEVVYTVKINRIVTDDAEKVKALLRLELQIKPEHIDFKEGTIHVESKVDVPKELSELLKERIANMIPAVKELKFIVKKEEKKEEPKKPKTNV